MSKQSIIIDTDPGQDDALAILMALANNELLEVLGITAVCGNIGVRATAANALKVLRLAGREDVPVFVGAAAPILGGLVTAEALHAWTARPSPSRQSRRRIARPTRGRVRRARQAARQPALDRR